MSFRSTKTFGHDIGLSCAFRQWRAESHCHLVHGYALAVKIVFEADELDCRNWVVDFGSLKSLRGILEHSFDHRLVVAEDDPLLPNFRLLEQMGGAMLTILPSVGCEKFAEYIFGVTDLWLIDNGYHPRCRVVSVEVSEHGANSAIYSEG